MVGGGGVLMVSASVLVPVPIAFVALNVTLTIPVAVGVPLISPVPVLMINPFGNGEALKVVGDLVAAI
jgi:hypothetical protein